MAKKDDLRKEIEEKLKQVKDLISNNKWNIKGEECSKLWDEMVSKAVELHKIVKPKHHKYMIENRGYKPDDPEFYNHIHPIEDLLAYMDDPHANDDPEDQTLDHEFQLRVYSRRWGHDDIYSIKRISDGWFVSHLAINGKCDKKGEPVLFKNLNQDYINSPKKLGDYMERLWTSAAEKGLSHQEVQEALDLLGEWVTNCEKSTPKGIFQGY